MILAFGFILLVAGVAVIGALMEGHLGGDSTPQEIMIVLFGLALASVGSGVILVCILTGSLAW